MSESVIAIIFNQERTQLVALKRRDVPVWVFPGGGIDSGETPEEAVIRESLEETGLTVEIRRKAAEYSPINRLTKLTHVYECVAKSGELKTGSETLSVRYFPIEELPQTFFTLHMDWLRDLQHANEQLIRKPIHQVTYRALLSYFFKHPLHVIRLFASRLGFPYNS